MTAETQAGIVRVLPAHGTVYLLGGTAAIPDSVANHPDRSRIQWSFATRAPIATTLR